MAGVKVPLPVTLRKYGLTAEEWLAILERQGGVCAICKKIPASGRMVTDHEHVRGWNKMLPEKRKLYVRGILCWYDNESHVGRSMTIEKARNLLEYMEDHELRKASSEAHAH